MRRSRLILAVGIITAVSLLAGCDPAVEPPDWEARIVGDELQIAACEPIEGDEIGANVEQATGERWQKFWVAAGDISVDAGGVLSAGVDTAGVTTQHYDGSPLTSSSVIVVFLYRDGDQVQRAPFHFEESAPDGYWLGTDGALSESPCA